MSPLSPLSPVKLSKMTRITITSCADGICLVKLASHSRETFADLIDALKACVPANERWYDIENRRWRIESAEALETWLDLAERQHQADIVWERENPCPPRRSGLSVAEAFNALHLLPSAPPELVKAAHRVLALLNHPDRGGSHCAMVELNRAYDVLTKSVEPRRKAA
jgi:hypothetical protein